MAASIATATVQIIPTTKGITGDIEDELAQGGKTGQVAGKQTGAGFKAAFAGAIGGIAASLTNTLMGVAKKGLSNITSSVDALAGYDYSMKFLKIPEAAVAKNKAILKDYSLSTMYSMEDVLNTSKVIAAGGTKNFGNLTKSLGNVVAMANGTGEEFNSMGRIMGKIQTKGKLQYGMWSEITTVMPEMSENIKKALKDSGAYTGDFATALSKGEVSAKEFNDALIKVDKDSNGMGEAFAKGSSFFSGSLTAISNSVERLGIELVENIGAQNITKFFNMISDGISKFGEYLVGAVKFISNNMSWIKPLTLSIVALAAAIKTLLIVKKVTTAISGLTEAVKPMSKLPATSGAGTGSFLTGLANGLKAFANAQVLLGALGLAGAMAILSGGVWLSIKIVSDALPGLGKALNGFNKLDGGNLVKVGVGIGALGAGLVLLTAGNIIDGLSKWLGFGGFGDTLKGIIEPIAELLPTIDVKQIEKFALLATGLGTIAVGFEKVKDIGSIGPAIATSITSIKDAVLKFAEIKLEQVQNVSEILKSTSNAIKGFGTINGENLGLIGSGLSNLAVGMKTLSLLNPDSLSMIGSALKQIVEPLKLLIQNLSEDTINKFSLLGTGMLNLSKGMAGLQGIDTGTLIAAQVKSIADAVLYASQTATEEMYSSLKTRLNTLKTALSNLSTVQLSADGIVSFLTNVSNKIMTLNNFNWDSAINTMKSKAQPIGKAVFQGIANGLGSNANDTHNKIKSLNNFDWASAAANVNTKGQYIGKQIIAGIVSGINNGAYQLNITISNKIDEMVAAAIRKAEINSPSKLFEDEVGYWIGAALGTGAEKGADDYQPNFLEGYRKVLSNVQYDDKANAPIVHIPNTLKVIDGNVESIMKMVADEKILRSNINLGLVNQ